MTEVSEGRSDITKANRWVIKLGSALLTDDGEGLKPEIVSRIVAMCERLLDQDKEVVIVSSGAVAAGLAYLSWTERPKKLHDLQAAAAVGQTHLVQAYEVAFARSGRTTAQILLSHDDVLNRDRYLNARNTLNRLLELKVIPIINENDTVATDEFRFGDNDTLAALVANLIDADAVLLLTDQEGFFTSDPRKDDRATLISVCDVDAQELDAMAGGSGRLGQGGMQTKLRAARLAARSATQTIIANGRRPEVITEVAGGKQVGTWLRTKKPSETARKQWLAGVQRDSGVVTIDEGAVRVLREQGKSLLPVGVISVSGSFRRGDTVLCVGPDGKRIARGLVNFDSQELSVVKGMTSKRIPELLGYAADPELIHRDNMVLL
jgi:glutamate 5-kinase